MIPMDRLETMAVFVAVADLRGFAPAARRLGLSPSAVTRMIAALEDRLSIHLLQRTTRSVTLTDAGARYLESARRILSAVEEADAAARAERSEPTGRLVVAAPSSFGRLQVAPLLSEFLARYPAVRGELTLTDRLVNLLEEGVDVAVRIGHLDDSSFRVRAVGVTRRVLVASPAYLAQRGRPRTPAELAGHALIQFTSLQPTPEWTFAQAGALERVSLSPALVTNSADVAVEHAERGGGLAQVLAYQALAGLRAGRLSLVLSAYEQAPVPIQLVYPGARLISASVRAFIELAVATRAWDFVALPDPRRGPADGPGA